MGILASLFKSECCTSDCSESSETEKKKLSDGSGQSIEKKNEISKDCKSDCTGLSKTKKKSYRI